MQDYFESLKDNGNYKLKYMGTAQWWIKLLNPVVKVFHLKKDDYGVRNLALSTYSGKEKKYLDARSTRISISLEPKLLNSDTAEQKFIKKSIYGNKKYFDLAQFDITSDWWQNGMYIYNIDDPGNYTFKPEDYNRGRYDRGYYSNKYSIKLQKITEENIKRYSNNERCLLDYYDETKWFFDIKLNNYYN